MTRKNRRGSTSKFMVVLCAALGTLVVLGFVLYNMGGPRPTRTTDSSNSNGGSGGTASAGDSSGGKSGSPESLLLYCAAGIRPPVERVAAEYEKQYGVPVQIQYGGSNTLLSQIEVAHTGDLYLAADDTYSKLALDKGLVKEVIPLAVMRPVIAVAKGNPKNIQSIDDLLRDDVVTALGNPDQAAIGQTTRDLLTASGQWAKIEQHVTDTGVFKPTVPEVANDVKLGSADAAIVWDTTLGLYPTLEAVRVPELDAGTASVSISVMTDSHQPTRALHFARYLSARDKGLAAFQKDGFDVVDGDAWAEVPELTFFCGSVNRRAVDSVIKNFEEREGVVVNTVYNGCGILTAQMRSILGQQQGSGFPDTYMACDRYYLESVKDWFQDDVDISDTEVVIAVPKGNPGNIKTLSDLAKPGMRVSVGQPEQCTIGVLTKHLLEKEGLYDEIMENVVTQTASSAMLVPTVTTSSVDATLAYATDTKAESDKVDTIRVESPAGKAIQPFAIARSSYHKYLGRRLYEAIAAARKEFEAAGFHFRVNDTEGKTAKGVTP